MVPFSFPQPRLKLRVMMRQLMVESLELRAEGVAPKLSVTLDTIVGSPRRLLNNSGNRIRTRRSVLRSPVLPKGDWHLSVPLRLCGQPPLFKKHKND